MLYKSSWHFSLGLILLTIIYHNVKSSEENEVVGVRRNILNDIKSFFEWLFKPIPSSDRKPEPKNNKTRKKTIPIKIHLKDVHNKPSYVLRSIPKSYMKYNGFQSDWTRDKRNELSIRKIDITSKNSLRSMYFFLDLFGKLFNMSLKAYKNNENKYRKFDVSGEDKYIENIDDVKTLIIIVDKQKKEDEDIIRGLSYLGLNTSFSKNIKQTTLREAYGFACIKVAIRKCYKALRRVNDIVCNILYKCKSSFKSTFLLKAKSSCITGFDYTIDKQLSLIRNTDYKWLARAAADERKERRAKYIDACVPHMLSEYSNTISKEVHAGKNLTQLVTHILRSKSDRKCQKFLGNACLKACISARDAVCSTYICGKRKKKAYTKECKNECKRSYIIKSGSSDSSKSSSSD